MSTLTPIKPRHQHVAKLVADSFNVDIEDALNAIRRSYPELRDFFSGEGPAHVFIFHQPRDHSAQDDVHNAAASLHRKPPPSEVYFSLGGDKLRPGHKMVYLLRAADGPLDVEKVSGRGRTPCE